MGYQPRLSAIFVLFFAAPASVMDAVQCAVVIQGTLKAENGTRPPERRMEFRIGINLGDVIVDGVNVAARLESLAEPGGICISGKVHDEIKGKLTLRYDDLGAQQVKNIAEAVRVYRVLPEAGTAATPTRQTPRVARKYVRRGIFSIAGLAIIAATVVFVQHLSLRPPARLLQFPRRRAQLFHYPTSPRLRCCPSPT
jgi:adenylate cyclase